MYTRWVWVIAISVTVGGLMWQLGGFGALFQGTSPGDSISSGEQLEDTAEDSPVNQNFTGDASPSDGNLVGLALSSIGRFFAMLGFAVNLPGELLSLGLPKWASDPLGYVVVIYLSIGLIQLAGDKIWR